MNVLWTVVHLCSFISPPSWSSCKVYLGVRLCAAGYANMWEAKVYDDSPSVLMIEVSVLSSRKCNYARELKITAISKQRWNTSHPLDSCAYTDLYSVQAPLWKPAWVPWLIYSQWGNRQVTWGVGLTYWCGCLIPCVMSPWGENGMIPSGDTESSQSAPMESLHQTLTLPQKGRSPSPLPSSVESLLILTGLLQ